MSIIDNEDFMSGLIDGDNNEFHNESDGEIHSEDENSSVKNEKIEKVEPKKRSVRNPRQKLNIEILTGNRGIHTIENYFKDIKFHGKGFEKQDLDEVLKRLQHWAHRMYPAYKFDDILVHIERLSKKKQLQHYMHKYRLDLLVDTEEKQNNIEDDAEDEGRNEISNEPFDEFDALINQQIEISKLSSVAPVTPATKKKSNNTSISINNAIDSPKFVKSHQQTSTPYQLNKTRNEIISSQYDNVQYTENTVQQNQQQSKLPSFQSDLPEFIRNRTDLTPEQLARIAENRQIAKEKLKAKKLAVQHQQKL